VLLKNAIKYDVEGGGRVCLPTDENIRGDVGERMLDVEGELENFIATMRNNRDLSPLNKFRRQNECRVAICGSRYCRHLLK